MMDGMMEKNKKGDGLKHEMVKVDGEWIARLLCQQCGSHLNPETFVRGVGFMPFCCEFCRAKYERGMR